MSLVVLTLVFSSGTLQTQLFRDLEGGGGGRKSCKQGSFLISNLGGDPGTLTPSVTAKVNQNRVLLWYNKNETSVVRIFGTVRPVVRSNYLEQKVKKRTICPVMVLYSTCQGVGHVNFSVFALGWLYCVIFL